MRAEFSDLPQSLLATLSCDPTEDFTCVACQQVIDCRWNPRGTGRQIPPLCCTCERVSGYDWAGRTRYRANIGVGSFMDRRNATRILALSDEIAAAANRIQWGERHVA